MPNTTPIEFDVLLSEFPPSQHELICRLAEGQTKVKEDRQELVALHGYDFSEAQAPVNAYSGCSDSRTPEDIIAAERAGRTLVKRDPGGFMTIGGTFTLTGGAFVELASAYKVPNIVIAQHSGCGAMNAIFTYHMEKGEFHGEKNGAEYIEKHKGPFFVTVAKAQKVLVDKVQEKGLAYYETLGIPLLGDKATQFQQAMGIQQVLWDYEATKKMQAEMPHLKISEPLAAFQHVFMDRAFVYIPKKGVFAPVPKLDNNISVSAPSAPTLPMAGKSGCSCNGGCTHG